MIPYLIPLMLAAGATPGSEMNIVSTAAITAVCSALTGAVLYRQGSKARTVTIDGKPSVRIEDEYVRRAELAEFKQEIRMEVTRIERSVDKLGDIILTRDESMRRTFKDANDELGKKIEQVAASAFEGRRRIHEEVNAQGKVIAAIGVNADIAKGLGTLGKALMSRPCNQAKPPTPPQS